jgi:hypothetical protein
MGSVPVQEKRLEEKGEIPVPNKKCKNDDHVKNLVVDKTY